MANSPDGRTSTDGSCYECLAPDGISRGTGWGVWMQAYGPNPTRWFWLPVPPPPAPPNYTRTTPGFSPSVSKDTSGSGGAFSNPVQFSSPGVGNTAPSAGQVISVTGATGSTANPAIDSVRQVVGQVPNGPAFSNPA